MASVVERHVVGTDVLRDATCLAGDDIGLADVVEQRRLAVIDVTHDGDNRGAWHEVLFVVLFLADCCADFGADVLRSEAELFGDEIDGLGIHTLIDADHDADAHASGDNLRDGNVHHRGELVRRDELRQLEHFALCCFVCQLFLHALADGLALLATVLGALAHLRALAGEASQRLTHLLCNFLVAYFRLQGDLLGLVLLLLLSAAALLLLRLARIAALLLLVALRLVGYGIDINALLADPEALLLVAALGLKAFATPLLLGFLFRTGRLVQAVQVYLALDGQTWSHLRSWFEAEYFLLLLLCWCWCRRRCCCSR